MFGVTEDAPPEFEKLLGELDLAKPKTEGVLVLMDCHAYDSWGDCPKFQYFIAEVTIM